MSFSDVQDSLVELAHQLERSPVARCAAPAGAALALCDESFSDHMVYWQQPDDRCTWVGFGAERVVQGHGSTRFSESRQSLVRLFSELPELPGSTAAGWLRPRVFGGAAFSAGRDGSGCWETFGDATFILPSVSYVDTAEGAYLLVVRLGSQPIEATVDLAGQVLRRACRPAEVARSSIPFTTSRADSQDLASWSDLVQAVQTSIEDGSFEKIVTARRITLCLSEVPVLSNVVSRLSEAAPNCVRFALRIGSRTFLGATPERLIVKSGLAFSTEALAGTIARHVSPDSLGRDAAAQLMQSPKDRAEHDFVVQAIHDSLRPLCSTLNIPPGPTVAELKELFHLRTPIEGQLRAPAHVLDLVERLHPTPAVGGLPKYDAENWIATHEAAERGWYAAPFGFCDSRGDGTFMVALRSALLHENKVHLYAGAGIVRDSDPVSEYEETELKLRGMLSALGLNADSASAGSPAGARD